MTNSNRSAARVANTGRSTPRQSSDRSNQQQEGSNNVEAFTGVKSMNVHCNIFKAEDKSYQDTSKGTYLLLTLAITIGDQAMFVECTLDSRNQELPEALNTDEVFDSVNAENVAVSANLSLSRLTAKQGNQPGKFFYKAIITDIDGELSYRDK